MCLDNTFAGRGCPQGPVALTHQPNCSLCSFSFKIVGDVGCSCKIVKSCVRCRWHGASHILIFESHSLNSFQSFSVGFVLHSSDPHDRTVGYLVSLIIAVYIQWYTFGERPHVGPMALLHWKRVPMHFFGYVVDMRVEC